jgi:hypothetical protein
MATEVHLMEKTMLAVALEDIKPGTHMAAANVDPDGTARVELLERRPDGWVNLTLDDEQTDSLSMAHKYDDLVVTRLPEGA